MYNCTKHVWFVLVEGSFKLNFGGTAVIRSQNINPNFWSHSDNFGSGWQAAWQTVSLMVCSIYSVSSSTWDDFLLTSYNCLCIPSRLPVPVLDRQLTARLLQLCVPSYGLFHRWATFSTTGLSCHWLNVPWVVNPCCCTQAVRHKKKTLKRKQFLKHFNCQRLSTLACIGLFDLILQKSSSSFM